MATPFLSHRQVYRVARHLVAVRHTGVVIACRAALASSHTNYAFAYAVVEQSHIELVSFVLVEETGVDEIRRLSLHGSVLLLRSFLKSHLALYQRTVERPAEVAQSDERQVFPYIQLHTIVGCALGVLVRVDKVRTSRHGVGPLYWRVKVFVESRE